MRHILYSSFQKKEVIFAGDGSKVGYPCDIEFDRECGQIINILVVRCSFFIPFIWRRSVHKIPWCDIERIGEDIIWVCGCKNENKH